MLKYTIFKDMLYYMAKIAGVTDADMNYCGNTIRIAGDTANQTVIIEVTLQKKEEEKDGN